jgi:hopene-associated glycosyltransferase HpnB
MTVDLLTVLAAACCVAWLVLCFFRGGFWRASQVLPAKVSNLERWPEVVVVIPARNEAATIRVAVNSLIRQDYPGLFNIVVVDDASTDDTRVEVWAGASGAENVRVIGGEPLPRGWTGKMWAVHQGLEYAAHEWPQAEYWLMTDADVEHHELNLWRLVAKAVNEDLSLVSLMVILNCEGFWERLLVPAFVFFFQKLYPFSLVNDHNKRVAAAAGGCILIQRSAFDAIGGVAAIRDQLIDDCALAKKIKVNGKIWIGLAAKTKSIRAYETLADVWTMVARTAFTQLNLSAVNLIGTVLAMVVVYCTPPVATLYGIVTGSAVAALTGGAAWLLMLFSYRPTLALYRLSPWHGLLLPLAAFLFTLMTVDSARRHWLGCGSYWKGRSYGRTDMSSGENSGA